jgi:adenosylcobyric acid synthase
MRYVDCVAGLGRPDAVILPGTKTTMADLIWLREKGLDRAVCTLAQEGAGVVGICGGYQMLGEAIRDPQRVESVQSEMAGLGLLPISTDFAGEKATYQVRATIVGDGHWLASLTGTGVDGYEIHMGRSTGRCRPWLEIGRPGPRRDPVQDGAMNETGRVWGCYLHGLFANDLFRRTWLGSLKQQSSDAWSGNNRPLTGLGSPDAFGRSLDRLADSLERALDMVRIDNIINSP